MKKFFKSIKLKKNTLHGPVGQEDEVFPAPSSVCGM
jgi:hypothetical protein